MNQSDQAMYRFVVFHLMNKHQRKAELAKVKRKLEVLT